MNGVTLQDLLATYRNPRIIESDAPDVPVHIVYRQGWDDVQILGVALSEPDSTSWLALDWLLNHASPGVKNDWLRWCHRVAPRPGDKPPRKRRRRVTSAPPAASPPPRS